MFTVAPMTSSPTALSTGTGSPVSIDSSTADATLDDATVGGDLLARLHDEAHADGEVVDRDLGAVLEGGGAGAELGQGAEGLAAAALGPGLEPLAEQDQRDDGGRGLEVDVGLVATAHGHGVAAPASRKTRATVDHR